MHRKAVEREEMGRQTRNYMQQRPTGGIKPGPLQQGLYCTVTSLYGAPAQPTGLNGAQRENSICYSDVLFWYPRSSRLCWSIRKCNCGFRNQRQSGFSLEPIRREEVQSLSPDWLFLSNCREISQISGTKPQRNLSCMVVYGSGRAGPQGGNCFAVTSQS